MISTSIKIGVCEFFLGIFASAHSHFFESHFFLAITNLTNPVVITVLLTVPFVIRGLVHPLVVITAQN